MSYDRGNINDDLLVVASRQCGSRDNAILLYVVQDSDGLSNKGLSNEQGAMQGTVYIEQYKVNSIAPYNNFYNIKNA